MIQSVFDSFSSSVIVAFCSFIYLRKSDRLQVHDVFLSVIYLWYAPQYNILLFSSRIGSASFIRYQRLIMVILTTRRILYCMLSLPFLLRTREVPEMAAHQFFTYTVFLSRSLWRDAFVSSIPLKTQKGMIDNVTQWRSCMF